MIIIYHCSPQRAIKAAKNTVPPLSNRKRARAALQVSLRYQKSHNSSQSGHIKKRSRGVLQISSLQKVEFVNLHTKLIFDLH